MTTAARTQCPRSAPLQPHEPDSTKLQLSNTHTTIPNQQNNASMTWQQKEDFPQFSKPRKNNRNRHQKKLWQHDDNKEAQVAVTDDKNALASVTTLQPPPPNNMHLSQDTKEANKSAPGKEYLPPHLRKQYIPPHLRKHYTPPHLRKSSAKGAKAEAGNGDDAANVSPFSSATTKSTAITKPDLTPSRAAVHNATPPSPPITPCEPAEKENSNAVVTQTIYDLWNNPPAGQTPNVYKSGNERCDIWDEPPAWPTPVFKKSGNQKSGTERCDTQKDTSAWHPPVAKQGGNQKSGNSRGPRRQPYKKNVWPKNKDMKPIPSSDNDNGGVEWKSDSNGDPDYDVKKLLDWNGGWLPPPESWCARRQWDDRHFGEHIEEWLNKLHSKCVGAMYYPSDTFNPEDGPCKELAPRYWLEVKVEGANLRESWKIISASQPKPLDDDPINSSPWWELYENILYTEVKQESGNESRRYHPSSYLNAVPVPEAKLDLNDSDHVGPPLWEVSAADKMQERKQRMEEQTRQMLAKRNRPIPQPTTPIAPVEDRTLHPRLNIYLRPVQAADVAGITEIYNWYVQRTIHAIEFDARTEDQMRQQINTITNANLPYLVAILKKTPSKPTPGYVSEKVVGFVYLGEYCSQTSLFRYTFEMELFVHPGHRSKGIGRCLMDKLLEMADGCYRARGGYEYVNNYEYLKNGPGRVIKTILVNCHHENGEDVDKGWQGKFLNFSKFWRYGRLPTMGYKNGKVVDVSIYAHQTGEQINPDVPPLVTG